MSSKEFWQELSHYLESLFLVDFSILLALFNEAAICIAH